MVREFYHEAFRAVISGDLQSEILELCVDVGQQSLQLILAD